MTVSIISSISQSEAKNCLQVISSTGKRFDEEVQRYALYCVAQVVEHNNAAPIPKLFEAMGRSTRKAKAAKYLTDFFTVGDTKLISISKKDNKYSVTFVKHSKDVKENNEKKDDIKAVIREQFDMRRRVKWFELDKKKDAKKEQSDFDKLASRCESLAKADVSKFSAAEKKKLKATLIQLMAKL